MRRWQSRSTTEQCEVIKNIPDNLRHGYESQPFPDESTITKVLDDIIAIQHEWRRIHMKNLVVYNHYHEAPRHIII